MNTYKMIEMREYKDEPIQFVGVYVLRWRQEWGQPTAGFVMDDEASDLIEEIHRLAMLPADGSEPREGESDDPMTLLARIAELTK
jgi:hypothetical protein